MIPNTIYLMSIGPWKLVIFLGFGVITILLILYLLTLQSLLHEIDIENRKINPSNVWLTLIPFFGLYWQFIIVSKIADSLRVEFDKRNIPISKNKPGFSVGITYCILFSFTFISFFIMAILMFLPAIGGIVSWIIYWVKIYEYKIFLHQHVEKSIFPNIN